MRCCADSRGKKLDASVPSFRLWPETAAFIVRSAGGRYRDSWRAHRRRSSGHARFWPRRRLAARNKERLFCHCAASFKGQPPAQSWIGAGITGATARFVTVVACRSGISTFGLCKPSSFFARRRRFRHRRDQAGCCEAAPPDRRLVFQPVPPAGVPIFGSAFPAAVLCGSNDTLAGGSLPTRGRCGDAVWLSPFLG